MSGQPCAVCGAIRKCFQTISSDGWHQPPCYSCGDPGYVQPVEVEGRPARAIAPPLVVDWLPGEDRP